jgi:hypothetical protein
MLSRRFAFAAPLSAGAVGPVIVNGATSPLMAHFASPAIRIT